MSAIRSYHRPATLDEALDLLTRPDAVSVVLGGGTVVTTRTDVEPFEVVDLQDLGLTAITTGPGAATIGAMALLQDVVDHQDLPPLLGELARREAPSTIRNAATVGGTIAAADPESELLAGLLVHETMVTLHDRRHAELLPLPTLLADPGAIAGRIITEVTVAIGGETSSHRTGRTPADRPIVAVAGRLHNGVLHLAATGVATAPVLISIDKLDRLAPPGDFRGSPQYRRRLVEVLAGRVIADLEGAPA